MEAIQYAEPSSNNITGFINDSVVVHSSKTIAYLENTFVFYNICFIQVFHIYVNNVCTINERYKIANRNLNQTNTPKLLKSLVER